ncbi:TPA: methionyl-tRNA formyltransferase [Campylobacter lari]|nr:methionyl-tRNA formyltransferase [Campylobacter lari]
MRQLKIGYFADGIWAHNAFKKIISDSRFSVKFIVPRYDSSDSVLFNFSKEYNIPYIKTQNINSREFINQIKIYNIDIFVSMSFNQIFKKELLNFPKYKTINCHAGKLPFYRGRNVLNWVLINNEDEFGITVHFVDEGIDTGDIILQKTYPISMNDDYSTILNKAYDECPNVLFEALEKIFNNDVNLVKQDDIHGVGFYCAQRKPGDEIIDWNQNSLDVFNFIRALNHPDLGAVSYINKEKVVIYKSELISDAPKYKGIPGSVVMINKDNFVVKTLDATLKITNFKSDKKIKIGDRFC